ncbi:MAG: hypothetical protein KA797_07955, partial [Chitinophagales bacterium]|nr:hypothetical protein [Chitinophagales bacterium]
MNKILSLILLIVLFVGCSKETVSTMGKIQLTLKTTAGDPVPNARVAVFKSKSDFNNSLSYTNVIFATSDASGNVQIDSLAKGAKYYLRAAAGTNGNINNVKNTIEYSASKTGAIAGDPFTLTVNPVDDVDGDGIKNNIDDDVDGDGAKNCVDRDVDGDMVTGSDDNDLDGDGA